MINNIEIGGYISRISVCIYSSIYEYISDYRNYFKLPTDDEEALDGLE